MNKFSTVFIANRAEIAVRVARTLRSLGVISAAPYTPSDAHALHRMIVDQAFPVESYLDSEAILKAARAAGAGAIHPGYGFLSENAAFARRCAEEGFTFIGPSPEAITAMGDKLIAKNTMRQAGLPLVPGWSGPIDEITYGATQVGYPLLVKAAAGGGGKGMRLVRNASELSQAIERAQSEAQKAFGDGRIFLERFIEHPRHIEVQIFGDQHGHALCFGERECSLQRRYQKIIEEAPSAAVAPTLRARLIEAGIKAVQALGYTGAGTIEFMLDKNDNFYFLEVNTRLQVEHPVTELTYGLDLVALQIAVAQGQPLQLSPSHLQPRGWAIEARIYAEDPDQGFLPSTGKLEVFAPPQDPFLRLDTGFQQGDHVSADFDPMLAKLIAYGSSREEARLRLANGLRRFGVLGVTTNVAYLLRIIDHPAFIKAEFHTQFLEENPHLFRRSPPKKFEHLAAALAASDQGPKRPNQAQHSLTQSLSEVFLEGAWATLGPWRAQR